MTPPAATEAVGQNDELKILARGFVALLEIARKLTRQEQVLQSRLQYAFDEVCTPFYYCTALLLSSPLPLSFQRQTMRKIRLALDQELLTQL